MFVWNLFSIGLKSSHFCDLLSILYIFFKHFSWVYSQPLPAMVTLCICAQFTVWLYLNIHTFVFPLLCLFSPIVIDFPLVWPTDRLTLVENPPVLQFTTMKRGWIKWDLLLELHHKAAFEESQGQRLKLYKQTWIIIDWPECQWNSHADDHMLQAAHVPCYIFTGSHSENLELLTC